MTGNLQSCRYHNDLEMARISRASYAACPRPQWASFPSDAGFILASSITSSRLERSSRTWRRRNANRVRSRRLLTNEGAKRTSANTHGKNVTYSWCRPARSGVVSLGRKPTTAAGIQRFFYFNVKRVYEKEIAAKSRMRGGSSGSSTSPRFARLPCSWASARHLFCEGCRGRPGWFPPPLTSRGSGRWINRSARPLLPSCQPPGPGSAESPSNCSGRRSSRVIARFPTYLAGMP